MMSCSTCGGSGAVDSGGFTPWGSPISLPCQDCSESSAAQTEPDSDGTEDEIWNTSQNQIYVRNLKQFVGYVDWEKQLLEFGISYDDFTCAKCYIADKCRSAFDSYNTSGDCLEEK